MILDISTAAIAEGKIKVAANAGKPLPEGCVVDADGRPTRDPAAFHGPPRGAILPFGGHKGYGLSVIAELLARALGGACTDPEAPHAAALRNNMVSLLLAPDLSGDRWIAEAEARRLMASLLDTPPVDPGSAVLLPGGLEQACRPDRSVRGIPLDATTCAELVALAARLGVAAEAIAAAT